MAMTKGWVWLVGLSALGLATACSEAKSDDDGGGGSGAGMTSTTSGMGGTTSTMSGMGGTTSTMSGMGGSDVDLTGLVINEISADNDDWVELYNTTSNPISLDNVRIADNDEGMPKVDEAVDLTGATVPAGGYLFILAKVDMAMPGEQTMCDPGTSPCWHAEWGLSQANGDVIYLIDANGTILLQADYPAAAVTEDMGLAWGRFPDGTGDFQVTQGTPGAANMAP